MSNKGTVLAFGAHPDDIEIGMGGTVAKLLGMGYDVNLIIATLPSYTQLDTKEERRREATMSAKVLGCRQPQFLDLSPEELNFGRQFVTIIDNLVQKYEPEVVFTQWIGDSHQDHQILTKAVISASRRVNNLFMYETTIPGGITEVAFRPQLFVDISDTLEIKASALECYNSQKVRGGHLWINAIVGRSSYRGYQMNTKHAETFEVIRTTRW